MIVCGTVTLRPNLLSTNLSACSEKRAVWPHCESIMNRPQRNALLIAAVNLLLVLAFPPYNYVSMLLGNIPTFDGFYFFFAGEPHRIVNTSFLALEVIVVLVNAGIAWLLLGKSPLQHGQRPGGNARQRAVLALVAINLALILLFPPFEIFSAVTKAALPTFEGFYFVFGDNPLRQIVSSVLYIEVALVLINGGLLWMFFQDKTQQEASTEQLSGLAQRIQAAKNK